MTRDVASGTAPSLIVRLLWLAGVAELAVGALHFGMPWFYRRSAGLGALSAAEDDYVLIVTYATGILLLAFGTLTLLLARNPIPEVLFPYLVVQSVLWAGRLLLEVLYPVSLDMFGIDPFTAVVLPGIAAELAVLVTAAVLARRWLAAQSSAQSSSSGSHGKSRSSTSSR